MNTFQYSLTWAFLGGPVKILPANAGEARDQNSIPVSGRSPGGRNGNALQYSCLENATDRGVWQAPVHGIAQSDTAEQRTLSLSFVMATELSREERQSSVHLPRSPTGELVLSVS